MIPPDHPLGTSPNAGARPSTPPPATGPAEWLIANALGSFAMGTSDRTPVRKYHGLLVARDVGHDQPLHALSELAERLELPGGERIELMCHDHGEPRPASPPVEFHAEPWPCWRYALPGGLTLERELGLVATRDELVVTYRVTGARRGTRLFIRPMLTMRPLHALTRENPQLDGRARIVPGRITLAPYHSLPAIELASAPAGRYLEAGHWHKGIRYPVERERGYPDTEDAFCPGQLLYELDGARTIELRVALGSTSPPGSPWAAPRHHEATADTTSADAGPPPDAALGRLARACAAYAIERADGSCSVVAGFPWFGEWSRDALLAMPGIALALGRIDWAHGLLDTLARARVDGLVPNILARGTAPADPCSIDASLLFVRAVAWVEHAAGPAEADRHRATVSELVTRLESPTRIGTWLSPTGELCAHGGDRPLTWMDARVDGRPVTPRAPHAVEIAALWVAAQRTAARMARRAGEASRARALEERAKALDERFLARFWLARDGYLADSHDDRSPDPSLRPNQLLAAALADGPVPVELVGSILGAVDAELATPAGLRTLSPRDPAYRGRCAGDVRSRDLAYHQGTVWPWLWGPYLGALRRAAPAAVTTTFARTLAPTVAGQGALCVGHIPEIHDGDAPHTARGAPAQAWSTAEVYRALRAASGVPERIVRS